MNSMTLKTETELEKRTKMKMSLHFRYQTPLHSSQTRIHINPLQREQPRKIFKKKKEELK